MDKEESRKVDMGIWHPYSVHALLCIHRRNGPSNPSLLHVVPFA